MHLALLQGHVNVGLVPACRRALRMPYGAEYTSSSMQERSLRELPCKRLRDHVIAAS